MAPPRKPLPDRFRDRTEWRGSCLEWTGVRDRHGYGKIVIGRKEYGAHRVAFKMAHGLSELPRWTFVCHTCDNRACVNPAHLFAGSPKDNTADMIAKGRKVVLYDDKHPNTKIRHSERLTVVELRRSGMTLKAIGKRYGVSFKTISDICRKAKCYGAA